MTRHSDHELESLLREAHDVEPPAGLAELIKADIPEDLMAALPVEEAPILPFTQRVLRHKVWLTAATVLMTAGLSLVGLRVLKPQGSLTGMAEDQMSAPVVMQETEEAAIRSNAAVSGEVSKQQELSLADRESTKEQGRLAAPATEELDGNQALLEEKAELALVELPPPPAPASAPPEALKPESAFGDASPAREPAAPAPQESLREEAGSTVGRQRALAKKRDGREALPGGSKDQAKITQNRAEERKSTADLDESVPAPQSVSEQYVVVSEELEISPADVVARDVNFENDATIDLPADVLKRSLVGNEGATFRLLPYDKALWLEGGPWQVLRQALNEGSLIALSAEQAENLQQSFDQAWAGYKSSQGARVDKKSGPLRGSAPSALVERFLELLSSREPTSAQLEQIALQLERHLGEAGDLVAIAKLARRAAELAADG